jgi:hypothetical protein
VLGEGVTARGGTGRWQALSKQRVYMNAVDTGWINDENPLEKVAARLPVYAGVGRGRQTLF